MELNFLKEVILTKKNNLNSFQKVESPSFLALHKDFALTVPCNIDSSSFDKGTLST